VSDSADEPECETCFVNTSNLDVNKLIDFGVKVGALDQEVYTNDVRSKIESGDTDISALVRLILDSGASISMSSDPQRLIGVSHDKRKISRVNGSTVSSKIDVNADGVTELQC
jgi:hypothetical protein